MPAVVVAEVWRGGATNARLSSFLGTCSVEPDTFDLARQAGELLARSGTDDPVDALVVVSAVSRGDTILTSDLEDIMRLVDAGGWHHHVGVVRV